MCVMHGAAQNTTSNVKCNLKGTIVWLHLKNQPVCMYFTQDYSLDKAILNLLMLGIHGRELNKQRSTACHRGG